MRKILILKLFILLSSCTTHFEIKNVNTYQKNGDLIIKFESDHNIDDTYFLEIFPNNEKSNRSKIGDISNKIKLTEQNTYLAEMSDFKDFPIYGQKVLWIQVTKPGKGYLKAKSNQLMIDIKDELK